MDNYSEKNVRDLISDLYSKGKIINGEIKTTFINHFILYSFVMAGGDLKKIIKEICENE